MGRPTSLAKAVARLKSSWPWKTLKKCKHKLRRKNRKTWAWNHCSEKSKSRTKLVLMKCWSNKRNRKMLTTYGNRQSQLRLKVTTHYSRSKSMPISRTKSTQTMNKLLNQTFTIQSSCYSNSETKENIFMTHYLRKKLKLSK